MLLYISILGILISGILFFFNVKLFRSSVYLAGTFFLTSFYGFIVYALFYSESVFLVSIVYINITSITYLIGPMIYWYVRSVLNDNSRFRNIDALHLLPAAIFLVTSLPYIFTPYTEKLRVAAELVKNIDYLGAHKPTVLYGLLSPQVVFLSRAVLVLIYTLMSFWMLIRYRRSGKPDHIFSGQQYMTKWIFILLGLFLILTISHSLLILESVMEKSSRFFFTLNYLQIFSVIGLSGLLVSPLFFPSILYGLPRVPSVRLNTVKLGESKDYNQRNDQGIKLPVFEDEYLHQIQGAIESFMADKKPYLHKDFNLPQLSVLTQIPVHHLAYFYREHLHQSFHDYRNKWRIEHAKLMIQEGKAKGLKLEAIGTLSGFSSRNTFFVAFKRAEGISSSEYASRINGHS